LKTFAIPLALRAQLNDKGEELIAYEQVPESITFRDLKASEAEDIIRLTQKSPEAEQRLYFERMAVRAGNDDLKDMVERKKLWENAPSPVRELFKIAMLEMRFPDRDLLQNFLESCRAEIG
jgi:hypothetical protein